MIKKYHTRIDRQHNQFVLYQTIGIILFAIVLLGFLVLNGIPLLTKLAILIGDIKSTNTNIEQTDKLAPPPPQLSTPNKATNSAILNLTGFAESNSTVNLFLNGNKYEETVASTDGKFEFIDLHLTDEHNTFYALAIDSSGNESQNSNTFTIIFDEQKPDIEISSPKDGQKFFGYDQQSITVTGKTEGNSQINLNNQKMLINSQGEFNGKIKLNEGENKLKFISTDQANNQNELEITVYYSQ